MAVRDDFSAGEVLSAADLNDTFAEKLDVAGTKILQVVSAAEGTAVSSTSEGYVDTGLETSITPQFSTSSILLIAVFNGRVESTTASNRSVRFGITDADNNLVANAQGLIFGLVGIAATYQLTSPLVLIGFSQPATTSPVSYKLRMRTSGTNTTVSVLNNVSASRLYAIERSA